MRRALLSLSLLSFVACGGNTVEPRDPVCLAPATSVTAPAPSTSTAPPPKTAPTPDDAKKFVADVDKELRRLWSWSSRAEWVNKTFINDDTDILSAQAEEANMEYLGRVIPQIGQFKGLTLEPDVARQLELLKIATRLPAPKDPAKRAELAKLAVVLGSMYSAGKYCPKGGKHGPLIEKELADQTASRKKAKGPNAEDDRCLGLPALSRVIAKSRNADELLDAWTGWHSISPPMRDKYARYVELGNEGAREIGFDDLSAVWKSGYDMSPADFEKDTDRLWTQVKPLYEQLHCYVRKKLRAQYGKEKVGDKKMPAHLLGNMWAQDWVNIYPLVEPYKGQPSLDVTKSLKAKKYDEKGVVKLAEQFFVSIGLDPLPDTFWKRSLFEKPKDREVACHASAWDVDYNDDLRIKMCVEITEEDLVVAHHELGHNYYYHYYYKLPMLFQAGANDGFHEGIGDTIALSVTPAYLKGIGLLDKVPDNPTAEINVMMKMALGKVAFLPFGKLIDQWRWDVFSGKTKPGDYNAAWWALKEKYQGVAPPITRSEADFDPGAKYHVPASTPYMRYFLAHIYQFQFHRALCKAAGHTGPLHKCSIKGSKAAGDKLKALLSMGASKPWPEAMAAVTGEKEGDASAILEYFAPLQKWLEQENKGETCGW